MQQTDPKNGDEKIEETTQEAKNADGDGASTEVPVGAEGEGEPPKETLAEWVTAGENGEAEADSAENGSSEGGEYEDSDKKIAELEAKSADLAAQVADLKDQLLRKAADIENFRKRMNQEKQNAIEFANQSLLLDIIPIIDDFDRAVQSAQSSAELAELPAGKTMLDGIAMIEKRLISQLEGKWGLKRFDSAGEPFDPNRHEAMMMEKSPDVEEPVVKEEFLKGYMLKDRVIRAAQVKVLMPE